MGRVGAPGPIRLVMVDDHPLLREGLLVWLKRMSSIKVVGVAEDGNAGFRLVQAHRPNILLLDLRLPDMSGVELARRISMRFPDTAIVVLTGYDATGYVPTLRQLGVRAVVPKSVSPSQVIAVIESVAAGENLLISQQDRQNLMGQLTGALTNREHQILRLVATGQRNADIATELALSIKTVEAHVSSVLAKLGARSRTESVEVAHRLGILSFDNLDTDGL